MTAATKDLKGLVGLYLVNCAGGMNGLHVTKSNPGTIIGGGIALITNFLRSSLICNALFTNTQRRGNVRSSLEKLYVNKDRVDEELVDMIIRPSLDDGAKQVFQSTLVGEPGLNPMELLPNIPENVKIGAIWGSEDFATKPTVPIAEFLKV